MQGFDPLSGSPISGAPPSGGGGSAPPVVGASALILASVLAAWVPAFAMPQAPQQLNPALLNNVVNNPPFNVVPDLRFEPGVFRNTWTPMLGPMRAQGGISSPPVVSPPPTIGAVAPLALQQWVVAWNAQKGLTLPPALLNNIVNNPPSAEPLDPSAALLSWVTTWSAQSAPPLNPTLLNNPSNPPPNAEPQDPASALLAWQVSWGAQYGAKLPPALANNPVAAPPSAEPADPSATLLPWQPVWGAQSAPPLNPALLNNVVNAPPGPFPTVPAAALLPWAVAWNAQSSPLLPQGTPLNVAPLLAPAVPLAALLPWQPTWDAQRAPLLNAALLNNIVNNPPFPGVSTPAAVPPQWLVTWGAQSAPKIVIGQASVVNNPPGVQPQAPAAALLPWVVTWSAQAAPPLNPALLNNVVNAPPSAEPTIPAAILPQWVVTWGAQWARTLPPVLANNVVNTPPGVRPQAPAAVDQWAVTWGAQSAPKLVQGAVTVNNPPFPGAAVPQAVAQWAVTWAAQGAPRLTQGASTPTLAPVAVPAAVLQAWQGIGWGAQTAPATPQTPPVVNAPPVAGARVLANVLQAWQVTWDAQRAPYTPQPLPANNPPFNVQADLRFEGGTFYRSFVPVLGPMRAAGGISATQVFPVNNPPPTQTGWLQNVLNSWVPPFPTGTAAVASNAQLWQGPRLPPALLNYQPPNPPFGYSPQIVWWDWWPPFVRQVQTPQPYPINNPPFGSTITSLVEQPGVFRTGWTPVRGRMPAPSIGFPVYRVDNPPFNHAISIVADWVPDYSVQPRYALPQPAPVNYPPFGATVTNLLEQPGTFYSGWTPVRGRMPAPSLGFAPPPVVPPVPLSTGWLQRVLDAWVPPFALPQTLPALVQLGTPPVNNPPFNHAISIVADWVPDYAVPPQTFTPWLAYTATYVAVQGYAQGQIVAAWTSPWQQPQRAPALVQTPPPVNNPPFHGAQAPAATLPQWASATWNAQTAPRTPQFTVAIQLPPFPGTSVPVAISAYQPAAWDTQYTRKLPQPAPVANNPPPRARDFTPTIHAQWVAAWGAQSAPATPQQPGFNYADLGERWDVEARITSITIDGRVVYATVMERPDYVTVEQR